MCISIYNPEPWLDDVTKKEFSMTREQKSKGVEALANAPDAPAIDVEVHDLWGKVVRTDRLGGAIAFIPNVYCIEAIVDQVSSEKQWNTTVAKMMLLIRKRNILPKGYHLGFVNPGRHSLVKEGEKTKSRIFMIFGAGFEPSKKDKHCGRYGPLSQHIQPGMSKRIMSGGTVQIGLDSDFLNYYRDWDSVYFIKQSSLDVCLPINVVKIYASEDISTLALRMMEGRPYPTLKGVAIVVPDKFWNTLQFYAGVSNFVDSDIIATNDKDVKFMDGRHTIHCLDVWQVIKTVNGKKARLSKDERQYNCLTPEAVRSISATRQEAAKEISVAYSEYAAGNASKLIQMTNGLVAELSSISEEDALILTDEEIEERSVLFDSVQKVSVMLATGLPCPSSEVMSLMLPLLKRKVKSMRMDGITTFSLPSDVVGPYGTALNARDCSRLGLNLGDQVTDIRFPQVGSGMINCTLRYTHYLDSAVMGDPRIGAFYQAEDYDGDLSIVIPTKLIDNTYLGRVSSKSSSVPKAGEELSLGQTFMSASFGKLSVGKLSSLYDSAVENSREYLIPAISTSVQELVDMAKKPVSLSTPISLIEEALGEVTPRISQVINGKFKVSGVSDQKEFIPFTYPIAVEEAKHKIASGQCSEAFTKLYGAAINELPLIFCPKSPARDGVQKSKDKAKPWRKGYIEEGVTEYDRLAEKYGIPKRRGYYENRYFELSSESQRKAAMELNALLKRNKQAVKAAHQIHTIYLQHVDALREKKENAYSILLDLRKRIIKADLYLMSDAMRALFYILCLSPTKRGQNFLAKIAEKVGEDMVKTKSVRILASLPIVVGDYSLKDMVSYIGYKPEPCMFVK